MSKSSKKKPNPSPEKSKARTPVDVPPVTAAPVVPAKPAVAKPNPVLPIQPAAGITHESAGSLVRFDARTKWYLGICFGLFFFFVVAKWHLESIPIWNTILPDGSPANRGLVAGKPRTIRMDDYAVDAPNLLSSLNRGFPLENEAIGGLRSGLVVEPGRHIVNIFRPATWGFFILDLERGYSFANMQAILVLLIGAFLLFMVLTKNQFYLSVTGALALLLSSGTTSWTFIPAKMTGYACAATVAFLFLLHEKRLLYIVLQSALLILLVVSFVLLLYPPYQVPLVYLFSLLIGGYMLQERKQLFPLPAIGWKLTTLAGASALAGWVLYIYYLDARQTIEAITNTVYPGRRSELGGTGFVANWYSEYYSWFFSDEKFPKSWLNSCEFSHTVTFAPVIIPLSIHLFISRQRVNWLLLSAVVFTGLMIVWVEVGFPAWLAQKSLFSMVPTRRAQIPMGAGSIVLTVIYLGVIRNEYQKVPAYLNALLIAAVIGFVGYTAWVNVNDSDGLLKGYQTFLPVLFFSVLNGLLLFTLPIRYRTVLFCSGLLLFLVPNIRKNPLSVGLSPITEHVLYKTIRPLVEQDPDARWMVNGSQFVTYIVNATGAKQITGVKYLPDRKNIMRVLDPTTKRDSAYNRYAHVTYQSYINGRDSVILVNQFEDAYVIAMDPCSPRMKQLNVKYQLFDHQPQPAEIRCMTLLTTLGSLQLYKANE